MHIVMLNGTQQIGQLVLIKTYCCSQTDKCLTFPFPSFLLPDSVNLTNNEIQTTDKCLFNDLDQLQFVC